MSSKQDIFDLIKEHLVSRGIAPEKLVEGADLVGDLDLDSLDTMEMTLAMEERFSIEIPDAELEGLVTIDDAVALVQSKLTVTA